ncbi:MAG: aminopeptidase [Gemmatimonadota bacterium]|nr:aminopeptidase [Gemmatimonadota bacterium]
MALEGGGNWLRSTPRHPALRLVIAGGAMVAAVLMIMVGPTACYLSRGAWEEAKILSRRQPIAKIIANPATPPGIRAKLSVVEAARRFAHDSLGLKTGDSFTTYSHVDHDTLVLVLSAAYRDRLVPYTWWFPVVGRVPYKGFFDFAAARKAARDLETQGFDVYLRPSAAFSTLGFFNDPLLNTTLSADSLELANTVIHELTHNTYYAPGSVPFNESFASFVGARGAAALFRVRGDSLAAAQVDARWADDKILGAFWQGLARTLDSAFHAHPTDRAARLGARDSIYARARRVLIDSISPRLTVVPVAYARRVRLDNAALLARRVYGTGLEDFDRLWDRNGRNLRSTIDSIIAGARQDPKDPFGAVRHAAEHSDN